MEEHQNENELVGEAQSIQEDDQRISALPAWLVSISVHAVLAFILAAVIIGKYVDVDEPPLQIVQALMPEIMIEDPPLPVSLIEKEIEIVVDSEIEVVTPNDLQVEVQEVELSDSETIDSTEAAPHTLNQANLGIGSNAFLPVGKITGVGIGKIGGGEKGFNRRSVESVYKTLEWFKRHQSVNGQWDVDGYMDNCQVGPKCEPGMAHSQENGDGDTACTAYALLCYLGAGFDHRTPGKFKITIERAVEYLKDVQNENGSFGKQGRNYENAVCAMALCEAYGMTNDPMLEGPAQKSIDYLIADQAKTDKYAYGLAWNYKGPNAARLDSSVSGWAVMALKAAKSAGLDVGEGWKGAKEWVSSAWHAANPGSEKLTSYDVSNFPYVWNAQDNSVQKAGSLMSVGALCAVFLGTKPGDVMLDTMINAIHKQKPLAYPCNTYFLYYNTYSMFQYGGEKWDEWNLQVRDMLVDAQHGVGSGCYEGSWDYEGTVFHGHETGRLLSTAYCCLALEVYFRHERINKR